MSKYKPSLLHTMRNYVVVPLGTTGDKPTREDVGRPVIRNPTSGGTNIEQLDDNYIFAATGANFESVVASVNSSEPTMDGFVVGSIIVPVSFITRLHCINSGSTALKVGDLVVAGDNGTLHTDHAPLLRVQKSTTDQVFRWQVYSLNGGTGAQNTEVTIVFIGHSATIKSATALP